MKKGFIIGAVIVIGIIAVTLVVGVVEVFQFFKELHGF